MKPSVYDALATCIASRSNLTARRRNDLGESRASSGTITEPVGEVWKGSEPSPRERSLVTVAALTALGNVEQLSFHLPYATQNGVTESELIELITHLAFYAGWPRAMSAMGVAKKVFAAGTDA